jgi:integrase/recombinase XerD
MTLMRATGLVREYVQAAGIDKKGACHLFRHTAPTLMLENGADLRYIPAHAGPRPGDDDAAVTRWSRSTS